MPRLWQIVALGADSEPPEAGPCAELAKRCNFCGTERRARGQTRSRNWTRSSHTSHCRGIPFWKVRRIRVQFHSKTSFIDILCPNSRKSILTFDLQLLQNRWKKNIFDPSEWYWNITYILYIPFLTNIPTNFWFFFPHLIDISYLFHFFKCSLIIIMLISKGICAIIVMLKFIYIYIYF